MQRDDRRSGGGSRIHRSRSSRRDRVRDRDRYRYRDRYRHHPRRTTPLRGRERVRRTISVLSLRVVPAGDDGEAHTPERQFRPRRRDRRRSRRFLSGDGPLLDPRLVPECRDVVIAGEGGEIRGKGPRGFLQGGEIHLGRVEGRPLGIFEFFERRRRAEAGVFDRSQQGGIPREHRRHSHAFRSRPSRPGEGDRIRIRQGRRFGVPRRIRQSRPSGNVRKSPGYRSVLASVAIHNGRHGRELDERR
mmetsp:Transcript_9180/g.27617  ORF Transcript_9180/g.27617 Transcript_9180/m.27617 type:complete len:246 (-) Transcript_9180:666-1403(-)